MTKRRAAMERLLQIDTAPGGTALASPPARSGAVRTMGLALDRLGDAEPHESVVELDTALLDPSFVRDRLDEPETATPDSDADTDPTGLAALAASIEDGGQAVPILVRPHPTAPGRYQIAYGHRRWAACRRLGRPVRAIVRPLDDTALVLAQGRENNARRDLTFIERAHFAAALLARGLPRPVTAQALGVDKTELTRLLGVANGLPEGLAPAIGRAPKAGRPRWLRLVDLCRDPAAAQTALATASATAHLGSDARFKAVLDALAAKPAPAVPSPAPVAIKRAGKRTTITVDDNGFAAFLEEQMDTLFRKYRARKG